MLRIKKVTYVSGYILQIHFSDGKVKVVDFEDLLSEDGFYLQPLREIEFFKRVSLDDMGYTICWPNGADFSPDFLYAKGKTVHLRPRSIRKKSIRKKSISKK